MYKFFLVSDDSDLKVNLRTKDINENIYMDRMKHEIEGIGVEVSYARKKITFKILTGTLSDGRES